MQHPVIEQGCLGCQGGYRMTGATTASWLRLGHLWRINLGSSLRTLFSLTLHGTSFSALNSTLIPSPIAFPRGKFIRGEVLNHRGARKKSPIAGFGLGMQAVFLRRVRQSVFSHPIVKTLPLRRCGLLHTDTGMAPTPQLTSILPTPVRHSQFQALTCIVDLARSQ